MTIEQVSMERFIQSSGVEVKLRLLEIPDGLVGHPYTVQRDVNGRPQQTTYGLVYRKAVELFREHGQFERSIGSLFTLLGGWGDD